MLLQQFAVVVEQSCYCVFCKNIISYLLLHEAELFGYVFLERKRKTLEKRSWLQGSQWICCVYLLYLVLPIILLGMTQHSVAKPANMSERSVALVSKLLQSQHGAITTVCERGLEKFENLKWK